MFFVSRKFGFGMDMIMYMVVMMVEKRNINLYGI